MRSPFNTTSMLLADMLSPLNNTSMIFCRISHISKILYIVFIEWQPSSLFWCVFKNSFAASSFYQAREKQFKRNFAAFIFAENNSKSDRERQSIPGRGCRLKSCVFKMELKERKQPINLYVCGGNNGEMVAVVKFSDASVMRCTILVPHHTMYGELW